MITIDGSQGEGGGQVLRSSLALSLITGKPFTINNIRGRRKKPGLLRQHLTAVKAAQKIGNASVNGAALHSSKLIFEPGPIQPGNYHFAVGTAGSATLVLQTVLPALLRADKPSSLRLEGGTHNPWAPPFDFLTKAFLPLVNEMGPTVEATLTRPGFYPAGGGEFNVTITPSPTLTPFDLTERGELRRITATAKVAHLPAHIAERELRVIGRKMNLTNRDLIEEQVDNSRGPGNIVTIEVQSDNVTELLTGFGEVCLPAEAVAEQAIQQTRKYLAKEIPVGEYLTDQLLIPLALSGSGSFRTAGLSRHAQTNIDVIKMFLDIDFQIDKSTAPGCIVHIRT